MFIAFLDEILKLSDFLILGLIMFVILCKSFSETFLLCNYLIFFLVDILRVLGRLVTMELEFANTLMILFCISQVVL